MQNKLCLSLFDHSAVWSDPWKQTHQVITYDIQTNPLQDVLELAKDPLKYSIADVILAAPPCTHFTNASSRYWKQYMQNGKYAYSRSLVEATISIIDAHKKAGGARIYAIENPVGRIKDIFVGTFINPRFLFKFHPHEFAGWLSNSQTEAYRKTTCLWGNFHIPIKNSVPPIDTKIKGQSYISLLPPSKNRANIRSKTPQGFSLAFYDANK